VGFIDWLGPMRAPYRVAALVAIAAWLCPKAYAPIFGTYPGLPSLIEQSEIIAAITILDRLPEWDFGGSDRYNRVHESVQRKSASEASLRVVKES